MRGQQGPGLPDSQEAPGKGAPEARLLDVILRLYNATIQPDAARTIMSLTAPLVGTDKAMYLRVHRFRPSESVTELIGVAPEFAAVMKNRKIDTDNIWRTVFAVPAGSIFVTSELIPKDQLTGRPRYEELTVPAGLEYAIGIVLENGPEYFSSVTYMRAGVDFHAEDKRALESLIPHMQTALLLSHRIGAADAGRREALVRFDRSRQAVVVLDRSGYALYCNASADGVLKNADGLELKFGRFLFENVTIQAEFERAVRVAAASIGSDIAAAPYKIRVTRRSVGSPFALAIVPVHTNADRALMPEGAACMILIHDPNRVDELPLDRLSWLYRLTPAEARICESLYRMGSIESAAQDLNLTRNTVRSHLKSIYGKFGVATQGQLIQRLANSVTFNRSFARDRLGTS